LTIISISTEEGDGSMKNNKKEGLFCFSETHPKKEQDGIDRVLTHVKENNKKDG